MKYSSDVTDEFLLAVIALCEKLGCKATDIVGCWISESNLTAKAHNPGGHATGFFQAMPATLRGLGFPGTWEDFVKLDLINQLPWAEKYYWPHRGRLVSPGACYLATFLPALMPHARESLFVLCGREGPLKFAYYGNNKAFDLENKGYITVQDLSDRIAKVMLSDRAKEIVARIESLDGGTASQQVAPESPIPVSLPNIPYDTGGVKDD